MKRRALLASLSLSLASTAGCLSRDGPPSQVRDVPTISGRVDPSLDFDGERVDEYTFDVGRPLAFGDHRPHRIRVANVAESTRVVEFWIGRWDGTQLIENSERLGPGNWVEFELRGPAGLSLVVEADGVEGRHDIAPSDFDCNDHRTVITVGDDGLASTTVATQMACGFSWP